MTRPTVPLNQVKSMDQKRNVLDRPILPSLPAITTEVVLFIGILLFAFLTRFYDLGTRVMSHDESLHTYFSWLLYRGQGYQHSPMMHGPFQFHIVALTYFLFGANDFTSRIPAALFSIATVWMVWYWRRYLGRWGALVTGLLLVISPYMLYYGRYVRNESFAGFSGIVMLYAILRHLEAGGKKYLYLLAAAWVLHFTAKETAYIYAAEALLFLAVYFLAQVTRKPWTGYETEYRAFIIALAISIVLLAGAVGYSLYLRDSSILSSTETAHPADPNLPIPSLAPPQAGTISPALILALVAAITLLAAGYFLLRGYSWDRIRGERSFDLLMVTGTIVLPLLSPFPVKWLEGILKTSIPTSFEEVQTLYNDPRAIWIIGGFLILMFGISIALGLIWDREKWLRTAMLFWIPYTILYTTIFTNSNGFFTGTVGSLGYWIVQQGVERGSQPWYYYLLVQIPVYEFLPALGFLLALVVGLRRKSAPLQNDSEAIRPLEDLTEESNFPNTFSLLVWWSVASTAAFSFAGERMPWLTYHIALPLILISGWGLGRVMDGLDWEGFWKRRALLAVAAVAIFIASLVQMILIWHGATPPFQGRELAQLQATGAFLFPAVASVASAFAFAYLLRDWPLPQVFRISVLVLFLFLAVLTGRSAFRAAYITYDQATEFLVYAHASTGVKEVIEQAREISERTTGGMGVAIAYDASAPDTGVSWPFVWYLRDFTNQRAFDQPTRSLRDSVVIVVDQKNFDKIEPAIGPGYYRTDYIRMWWPMQDYFNLVMNRDPTLPFPENYSCKGLLGIFKLRKSKDYSNFCEGFTNPAVRAGLLQIWLNRDYTQYAQAKGRQDLTLAAWQPSNAMRMYIRQDVASLIWNYGLAPSTVETVQDPTEGKFELISANLVLDETSQNPVLLNGPRSLAFARNGTFYVADSRNHRVLHLDSSGSILHQWGSFADGVTVPIGDGTFNEPWGIAVGADGSVFVTDTWNHRIEKFTPTGRFLQAWGFFGQGEAPDSFYGPRGLAMDAQGRLYVTDTGNKRVVVFDGNGDYITQFGGAGFEPGFFDEPVGITIDKQGAVYVADTWNQRIQVFEPLESDEGLNFIPTRQWDVFGWFGQSLENKPYLAVNDAGHVFITDPEGYRVIEFDGEGSIVRTWGEYGESATTFGLASGIALDQEGQVWVTDGAFNRLLRFTAP
jgi:predicted membrane-bound mannosyltransferase/DNA-binding beta-propeller fold protein YncE